MGSAIELGSMKLKFDPEQRVRVENGQKQSAKYNGMEGTIMPIRPATLNIGNEYMVKLDDVDTPLSFSESELVAI